MIIFAYVWSFLCWFCPPVPFDAKSHAVTVGNNGNTGAEERQQTAQTVVMICFQMC